VQGQGFRKVLCYEPGRGATSEHGVDAIFRAMAPFIGMKQGIRRVAMPVVGTGDQGGSQEAVLPSLLQAAYDALSNTALERIRLVEHDPSRTPALRQAFEAFKATHLGDLGPHGLLPREYDVFISYSTKWAGDADFVHDTLTGMEPGIRIFQDAHRLEPGKDYRTQLDLAMRSSARVMTLYTPEYLESNACKDEFNTAWAIRTAADPDFLFPMFVRRMSNDGREIDASLDNDSRKTTTHYVQCIEADKAMMRHGCEKLLEGLTSGKPAMMI
jgi:hypothetical protein